MSGPAELYKLSWQQRYPSSDGVACLFPVQHLNPNVPVTHLATVILQQNRPRLAKLLVDRSAGGLREGAVVNHGRAVLHHGETAILRHLIVRVHPRSMQSNVIGLPLLRRL